MGWAKTRVMELEAARELAQERMPENIDLALSEIAHLRHKVVELEEVLTGLEDTVAAQNSWRARYQDYVLGGIVGAIISLVFTMLL